MSLPSEYRKLVCVKVTPNFREAVSVVTKQTPKLERNEVFLKTKYAGINASDVNVTAARYSAATPPFNVGVESVAEVVAVGDDVKHLSVGSAVATINVPGYGAFSEYQCVLVSKVFPIPRAVPEVIPLLISGLTAAIGLDEQGRIKEGETVLITAAAGGLGHLAVQWAKAAKCHVIGTCSSPEKEVYLKSIGCDKVINYKTHDLGAEVEKSYPNGVDVIWETIGGKTFEVLLNHLSIRGRLVVVGAITGYQGSDKAVPDVNLEDLPSKLLMRSASVSGFFLPQYSHLFPEYVAKLQKMLQDGTIVPKVDFGLNADGGELKGLDGCVRGVEYLHSGKSVGKVVVKFDESA
uniref:15-oxoprostaglandin 13-reductase n=1 Tax=Ixodes ricinus TaxID=34613 RepID=V5IFD0_IXORI